MSENLLFAGGAGLLGLMVGFLMGGVDEDDLSAQVSQKVTAEMATTQPATAEQMAALSEALTTLGTEVAAVKSQVGAGAEQQAALSDTLTALGAEVAAVKTQLGANAEQQAARSAAVQTLSEQLGTFSTEVQQAVAVSSAEQIAKIEATLSTGLAELQGSLNSLATSAPAADAPSAEPKPAPAEPEIEGTRVGQTEILLGGAARVFVSGIDAEAGTARVALNGTETGIIGDWQVITFEVDGKDCRLKLDDVVQGHVQMTANCEE